MTNVEMKSLLPNFGHCRLILKRLKFQKNYHKTVSKLFFKRKSHSTNECYLLPDEDGILKSVCSNMYYVYYVCIM